jgi:hypothetical protein
LPETIRAKEAAPAHEVLLGSDEVAAQEAHVHRLQTASVWQVLSETGWQRDVLVMPARKSKNATPFQRKLPARRPEPPLAGFFGVNHTLAVL